MGLLLEVLNNKFEKTNLRTRSGDVLYRVICKCGNECKVRGHRINTWQFCRTCAAEKAKEKNKGSYKEKNPAWTGSKDIPGEYLGNIKRRCLKHGHPCELTITDLQELWDKQKGRCAYSNIPLEFKQFKKITGTASLDRIDSTKGYVQGNVQWLHKRVNWIKNTLSESEFFKWVKLIAVHKNLIRENYESSEG